MELAFVKPLGTRIHACGAKRRVEGQKVLFGRVVLGRERSFSPIVKQIVGCT